MKPAASYHYSIGKGGSTTSGERAEVRKASVWLSCAAARAEHQSSSDSFPLQKGLIFESMPLTAEVPVSRPRWLGFTDCP
jgi:hypothetical protein